MPIDYSKKMRSSFEELRIHNEPMIIIYDVLGHFPHPRDHLSIQFCENLNQRGKNGFLFSKLKDLVLTSSVLDLEHLDWLSSNGFALGGAYLVNE